MNKLQSKSWRKILKAPKDVIKPEDNTEMLNLAEAPLKITDIKLVVVPDVVEIMDAEPVVQGCIKAPFAFFLP